MGGGTIAPVRQNAKAIIIDMAARTALILRLEPIERARRGIDEWHVPGGSFDEEQDHKLTDTVWRETGEETGLTREQLKLVGELGSAEWDGLYLRQPAHFKATFFLFEVIRTVPEQLALSDESAEYRWLPEAEVIEFPHLTAEARQFIPQGFAKLDEEAQA